MRSAVSLLPMTRVLLESRFPVRNAHAAAQTLHGLAPGAIWIRRGASGSTPRTGCYLDAHADVGLGTLHLELGMEALPIFAESPQCFPPGTPESMYPAGMSFLLPGHPCPRAGSDFAGKPMQ